MSTLTSFLNSAYFLAVLLFLCKGRAEIESNVAESNSTNLTKGETDKLEASVAEQLIRHPYIRSRIRCTYGDSEGICLAGDDCFRKSGIGTDGYCESHGLVCCLFVYTCGDIGKERVTYFRSPNFPDQSTGSLACDYDIIVHSSTCALRIDYLQVNLAKRLGGICDIDQLLILNSVDGPTSAQCGLMSGYSTTVAVSPRQNKPVKIALIIQNERTFTWDIRVTQLACNQLKSFKSPDFCGEVVVNEIETFSRGNFNDLNSLTFNDFTESHLHPVKTWWSYPEPITNAFYYSTTKRHLEQEATGIRMARRRVISGVNAYLGEFPWMVAIGLDQMFFCGGALLSESLVLTAAHCFLARDTPMKNVIVHLGDLDLISLNDTEHELRGVQKIMFHSHFHPFLLANDIALVQLDRPVFFTDTIQPVCLPEPTQTYTGHKATVVGWGVTAFPMGDPSPILQKLDVEILSNFQCSRMIEEPITLGMMCAAPANLQGTCFGDSGGPLTVELESGRRVLAGVVSFGVTGCAVQPAFPDLYSRVSEYMKWIDVNTT